MSVEDELRDAIKADARTQSDIARAIGLNRVNLNQFMNGKRDLPLKTLRDLAALYGRELSLTKAPKKK